MTAVVVAPESPEGPVDPVDPVDVDRPAPGRWAVPVLVLLVSLLCHGLMATGSTGPVWMDDEVGYLGNAAWLAGADRPLLASPGYWAGWSVVLVPLYVLLDDPAQVYAAAVGLSALLGALVAVPSYALARSAGAGVPVAAAAAAVVTNVPERTVMSNYALSENALVLAAMTTAALVFAAGRCERAGQRLRLVLAALAALATFAVHARGVALVAGMLGVGLLLLADRAGRRTGLLVLVVSGVGAVVVYRLNSSVVAALYDGAAGGREGDLLATLLTLDPTSVVVALVGQAWYQVAAWAGLSVAGAAVVVAAGVRGLRQDWRHPGPYAWLAVVATAALALSVLLVSNPITRGSPRVDILFYGRYLTHAATLLALVGLVHLLRGASRRAVAALLVVMSAIGAAFFVVSVPRIDTQRLFATINVPAVAPWPWPVLTDAERLPVVAITVTGLLGLLLVVVARRRPLLLAVVVVLASVVAGQTAQRNTLGPFDGGIRSEALPFRHTLELVEEDGVVLVAVPPFYRNGYQFWLWPGDVRTLRAEDDLDVGDREVVVAARDEPALLAAGARVVVCERSVPQCLWVLPGDLAGSLARQGALALPEGRVLPPRARAAELEVVDVVGGEAGQPVEGVRVAVRHVGSGAPWPALGAQAEVEGVVRLVAGWDGGTSLADLPRSMVPGDEVEVVLPVTDLVPGADEVVVRMIVEGDPTLGFTGGELRVPVP